MKEFFDFLNQNSGALIVIFTTIVAVSTIVYALLTYVLVNETRKMRHAQTEPRLDIICKPREEWIALIDIVIKNIGLGPAYGIKFDIISLTKGKITTELIKELKEKKFLSTGLNYLSPGQEISSFFTNTHEKFEEKMVSQILIKVSYKNASGQKYRDRYVIDLSEFKGMQKIGEPPLYKIAKNIEAIKKDIGYFASGFKRLRADIYTSEDRQREETKLKEHFKNVSKKE
jgi:hypothetical protein